MRVVNSNLETLQEYDLGKGFLIPATAIKENATPIDNVTKFAWHDDDYEDAMMYIPNPENPQEQEVTTDDVLNALLGVNV